MALKKVSELTSQATPAKTAEVELEQSGASFRATLAAIVKAAAGKQTLWVPASAMRPTVSNPAAALVDTEISSGVPNFASLDFDGTTAEYVQFAIAFPKMWNEGSVTFQVLWTSAATDTDAVVWQVEAVAVSDGEAIGGTFGTPVTVTDAFGGTANQARVTAESAALTIAGTPAVGDIVYFRVGRLPADAGDTMAEDAKLLGLRIFWTNEEVNDD